MEIQELVMKNIPYAMDEAQVTRELARLLHGPLFLQFHHGGALPNFVVDLIKSRNRNHHQHSGRAKLFLPSPEMADHILNRMNKFPFKLYNRIIKFKSSRNPRKREDMIAVLSQPYRDPQAIEEEQRRRQELEGGIKVDSVRFGYHCHDDTVSIEWSSPRAESWSLEFSVEDHQIVLRSSSSLSIRIALKAVGSATLDSTECVFWLERPPIFEKDKRGGTQVYEDNRNPLNIPFTDYLENLTLGNRNAPTRNRLISPDPNRPQIFSYLRVVCVSISGYRAASEFKRKARTVGLNTFASSHLINNQNLFGPAILDYFNGWLTRTPFKLAFQLEALVTHSKFNPRELLYLRQEITNSCNRFGEEDTITCIRGLLQDRDENPEASALDLFKASLEQLEYRKKRDIYRGYQRRNPAQLDVEVFQCHRVMVTPTSTVLHGPFPDETNRVLRKYSQYQSNFLRVEFREEDRLQMRWDRAVDGEAFLDERVGSVLRNGITVAGRKFNFLAYSQSALKEHAVWFMTEFVTAEGERVTTNSIINSLGDFRNVINCPARYGARIAQAFSTTEASVTVEPEEMLFIPDIVSASGSMFTDGVGTISPEIADEIWHIITESRSKRSRRRLRTPSAFQIRLGGVKGMLCVDESLEGRTVCIRPSMNKFKSPDRIIEIARAFDRPMAMFLNRPLIMLLETLNIPLQPFLDLQRQAVKDTEEAAKSLESAARLLEQHGLGTAFRMTSILLQLHRTSVQLPPNSSEGRSMIPFVTRLLSFAVNHVLRDLKYRARIPVPNAWTLVGVADEYGYLNEGEIYAYVCTIDGRKEYVEGPVLISRSPTVHPGDARMVRAIGKPPKDAPDGLKSLSNCVVFSTRGERSLPSMLAGGDLDGDIYCLIRDERLHPRINHNAGKYETAKQVKLERDSTMEDVGDFVVNYIKSDILGIIAMQQLRMADRSPSCLADPNCLKLAALHSDAVDFPKTGRPVELSQLPKLKDKIKPDWLASETNEKNPKHYTSQRIIGHLFRDVKLPAIKVAERMAERQRRQVDVERDDDFQARSVHGAFSRDDNIITRLLHSRLREGAYCYVDNLKEGDDDIIDEMLDICGMYSGEAAYICRTHSLSTSTPISEEELVAGTIVAKTSQPRMRQDAISAMRRDATTLCSRVREEIEGPEGITDEDRIIRAWTAWKVSVAFEKAFGTMSFGLLALDVIFDVIKSIDQDLRSVGR